MNFDLKKVLKICLFAFAIGCVVFLGTGTDANADTPKLPSSHPCTHPCLHNAQQKKDLANYGAYASIQWKKVNLFTGKFSYHRVASIQTSPFRFVEFGWIKDIQIPTQCDNVAVNSNCGLIVYNAGVGNLRKAVAITKATHVYQFQYDPNTSKYFFYLDGANVYDINAGFGQGNQIKGGGEVADGLEQMKDVQQFNLKYVIQNGGGFQYVPWNGYVDAEQEFPYSTIDGGANDFFNHGP